MQTSNKWKPNAPTGKKASPPRVLNPRKESSRKIVMSPNRFNLIRDPKYMTKTKTKSQHTMQQQDKTVRY